MATKNFDLMTALVQAGFKRGNDKEIVDPVYGSYQTKVLRKSYGVEDRINDYGILNEGFEVEVQVTFHNNRTYNVRVFYSNGKVKDHVYNKRAYNAIKDTLKYAGFGI